MLAWYKASLASRPLLTQSVTTAVLFATGDTLAQQAVEGNGIMGHDLSRTGRMAFYGGCIFGPAATMWFRVLQNRVVIKNSPHLTTLARVAADQCLFATGNLFFFLSTMAVMEGKSPKDKLAQTYTMALKKNWMVWPAVQFVNFTFVPLHHRVLVVNVVSLGWNCYLSFLNSQPGGAHVANPELPPDV
ncbi:probable glomerulosclerosis protein Mpv17 [Ramularia collo-cygni]|uniref:Probable glomerulosclerosis protein Mpv17 n=1 Tax=Ramularia collo-cygni TaxID=112498 RepID=A0A2D3VBC1_9PEZI|nr:probable glomerulosclerosis protein Mpv17 [Ramularia collo-cygni]CZT25383.1 probable glomerulosclerosis protein Mpv17 [Ramularia collo-cygni]